MDANQIVARNLKELRDARGLNQTQAGSVIGVSQQTWARYEKGEIEITVNLLEKIAADFKVSMFDLLSPGRFVATERHTPESLKKARTARQGKKQAAPS